MNPLRMAWRNVWRRKRRALVTIAAMALALWVELVYAGLLPGYLRSMEDSVVGIELGDLQVHAPGYLDDPSVYRVVDDLDGVLQRLHAAGYAAAPRLVAGALAAAGEASAGVRLVGVDVALDRTVLAIGDRVANGAWLDPAEPAGVVLGGKLARNLGVGPGDELIVLGQAADGSIAADLFTVRGVLGSVSGAVDQGTVFLVASRLRDLMALPPGAHEIVVRRGDRALPEAAAEVAALLPGLDVRTWKQLRPVVAQMFESSQGAVYIVFFIVYVAVGLVILNAMSMAVFERIREFGVLKALGAGPGRVFAVILAETAVETAVAMGVGLLLAAPGMAWIARTGLDIRGLSGVDVAGVAMADRLKGIYDANVVAGPLVMLWAVSLLAALPPAVRAARIRPVQAMRSR